MREHCNFHRTRGTDLIHDVVYLWSSRNVTKDMLSFDDRNSVSVKCFPGSEGSSPRKKSATGVG